MPRFLNTYTGEFVSIAEIGATSYAILSHTWQSEEEGGEQTFDDVVKLQAECPIADPTPWDAKTAPPVNDAFFSHPNLSEKIKRACEVARNAEFRLIWIDSCCIDKRSSAELSEAINSMYALYRDADVCFVFLADVPHGTDPRERYSKFRWSRWHSRGWTLQELVAPPNVVFLTCDWTFLGTKTSLASTLKQITGVDAEILLGLRPVESASVAKRMSWAAWRKTTRVEDRAYSLLGIFGVHMSPIYGEGTNAFLRLQEEIIKHIPDQSIFAWGLNSTLLAPDKVFQTSRGQGYEKDCGLLAPSPDAFAGVGDVAPITASNFAMRIDNTQDRVLLPPLHCVLTPQGARIELMTVPLPPETAEMLVKEEAADCNRCREAMARSPFRCLALLRCTDRDGHLIALPLHCPEEDVGAAENVTVGIHATCAREWHASSRVVRLAAAVFNDLVTPKCVEVSLLRHRKEPVQPKAWRKGFSKAQLHSRLWLWRAMGIVPEIRMAPKCEEELGAVGFTLTPLKSESRWLKQTNSYLPQLILTTTLNMQSTTQQAPDDDKHVHRPMIIGLVLQCPHPTNRTRIPCHFFVDRLHSPSGIPYSSTSRTLTEARFLILDCTVSRTNADGASMDYVRLLRLKLENSPDSAAYIQRSQPFLFSVELSEPFLSSIFTESQSEHTATPAGLAPSQHLEVSSQIQAAPEASSIYNGSRPYSEGTPQPLPPHNATPESLNTALSLTATSEQTAVCERSGAPPGPCDTVIHDGPDVAHTDGPSHDTAQDTLEPATPPTATSEQTPVVGEAPLGRASSPVMGGHLSEHLAADVTGGVDTTSLQDALDDLYTDTSGFLSNARQDDTIDAAPR
ncbi:heterokaryon incompatibility protein-domain-containing protein [Lenzites betulinus]|nr:heterokaryon incompatibility protein-domain-containing protein [Lenzites betulinus]